MTRSAIQMRPVLRMLGWILLVQAACQVVPAVCCLFYRETGDLLAFLAVGALTALAGAVCYALGGPGETYQREGILIVALGWWLASALGALPYLFTGTLDAPVDALFESASGFTTTGATVLADIEAAGRGILFWRCFSQWLGGMGIIVLFVALLPELGPGARFLYKLEVPGPTAEALRPRIRDTAAVLWRIYLVLTAAQTLLLLLCGLDLYDALTHSFSTMSTGGFSPRAASIAAFDSVWVHLVILVFMILAGTNFSLFYALRRGTGWTNVQRDSELRLYLLIMAGAALVIAVDLVRRDGLAWRTPLDAAFQAVSIMTTTGFTTVDFAQWPQLSRGLLVALMFVGGCAGSTSGSMKVMRMVIGLKAALREVRLLFAPNRVMRVTVGGNAVPEEVVHSVAGFFILFLTCWGIGTLLVLSTGPGLITAATAAITTLGNVGPGLEAVGPVEHYAFYSAWEKLVLIALMWIGRLEVYSLAALLTAAFWRR